MFQFTLLFFQRFVFKHEKGVQQLIYRTPFLIIYFVK